MFDVVRGRSRAYTRLRPALVVSVLAHAVLLAGAVLLSHPAPPPAPEPRIRWSDLKASLRGGGGGSPAPAATPPRSNGRRSPRTVRTPLEIQRPVDLPPRTAPATQEDDSGSDRSGVPGGTGSGGTGNGPECATPPCGGGPDFVSEDVVAEMPVLLSAPEVVLSPEARRSGVEGTMLVRCLITAAGSVEGCEVLRGLPLSDAAVIAALQGRHYRPAEIGGRPVSVRHLFTIKVRQAR